MNWLKKLASVTFKLKDSDRISQPKSISDLGNSLYQWAQLNVPRSYFRVNIDGQQYDRMMIEMDGLEPHQLTGTINWYFQNDGWHSEELVNDIPMYINQWIQEELTPFGFKTKIRGPEQSKMWSNFGVYRVDILSNPTESYPSMPEINMTNINAQALCGILNIPRESTFEGSITLQDLMSRLQKSRVHIPEFTRDGVFEKNFVDFGIDDERLDFYVQKLTEICDFGLKNGFQYLEWS